jgi:hypothetical protein
MTPVTQIAVLCAAAASLMGLAAWILVRFRRRDPARRERRRRSQVNLTGRIGDAMITGVADDSLFYTYSVNGVAYSASQDIAALKDRLPSELGRLVGVANVKYSPRNPANSILLCEEWTGLRQKATSAKAS